MRLALQIYSANYGNRRVWLDGSQVVRIGRTTKSELTVPDDPHLSGLHFSISREGDQVVLKDLQSRNGTFVNGAKVGAAIQLHDGDVIVAGKTQFQVVMLSDSLGETSPAIGPPQLAGQSNLPPGRPGDVFPLEYDRTESIAPENNPFYQAKQKKEAEPEGVQNYPRLSSQTFKIVRRNAGLGSDYVDNRPQEDSLNSPPVDELKDGMMNMPSASRAQALPQRSLSAAEIAQGLQMRYETRLAPSGMTYFCPRNEVKPPTDVADFIGQNRFLYAIANYGRLQPQQQPGFYQQAMAAGAVQISSTQLLIAKQDSSAFHEILRQAWGQDAIICMASRLDKVEFASLTYRLTNELASPAELLNHLYSDGQYTNYGFLDGISAILLEIERGARWVIFKNDQEIRTWRTLGLPCPPELVG
ncbi:FHA domain-containing protein [Bremerella cremea]|uniref:FHA domain-containing protein n=1 Tax=Bremerella cremea TaxID=1031537 RepID=UPI001314023E|nr:FHA domain-containing protein [Bremerella cremea]